MTTAPKSPDCVIVGGGPGGMFLALFLARQGVRVTLLEAHHDFDRDFRGDTIHPTTLELLDQMGLARQLHALPHAKLREFRIDTPREHFVIARFADLPTRFPYIMLLPQAELLSFLAQYARRYPHLQIEMSASASQLICEGGVVRGLVYKKEGRDREIRAPLTVGADGRFSKLRKLAGLEPVRTAPPMDVLWFRLPRHETDPQEQGLVVDQGRLVVLLLRRQEWQIGFMIPKGGYQQLRQQGIEAFHREFVGIVPWMADRVARIADWGDLTLLSVESSRLKKWYLPGMLLIGDAAHVMSPVGGVGINYAIQDAVAAANLLAEPLLAGEVRVEHLAAVQRRRERAVRFIQMVQGLLQRNIVAEGLDKGKPFRLPMLLRVALRMPVVRTLPGRILALGIWRERLRQARPGV